MIRFFSCFVLLGFLSLATGCDNKNTSTTTPTPEMTPTVGSMTTPTTGMPADEMETK